MPTLLIVWHWIKDHTRIVFAVVIGAIGFIGGGLFVARLRRPDTLVKGEIDRMNAGKEASQVAIQQGADVAVAQLHEQHATTIQALDSGQKAKAETLKQDPQALAKYLTDLSNK